MNSLILGGSGFIGSHLVDRLLAMGDSVRVLSRGAEKFRDPIAGVEYVYGDFSDRELIEVALKGIDHVYHCVSTSLPASSMSDPIADIQGNLINTVQLLDCIRHSNVERTVFLSSGGTVYGIPSQTPIPENHPLRPISSYGIIKSTIEKYLLMYHSLNDLNYLVLRVSNPYGPRQGHGGVQGVIGTFLNRIYDNRSIEIWGDGKIIRDFINIHDLTELCITAARSDRVGIYNAGSGVGHSLLDLIKEIEIVVGGKIDPVFKPSRNIDVPEVILDIEKAKTELGWQPTTQLNVGLKEYWQWLGEIG